MYKSLTWVSRHTMLYFLFYLFSIGYRTFQTKELFFIGSERLLFPHEYTGEGRDPEVVEAFTCVRVRKKNLSIFYNAQFFCLKCTV
jgi:hypothetical protein